MSATPRVKIGYWAAHEQYPPSRLLEHVVAAERAGFENVFTSDHFMPWFDTGAQSGAAWPWMAACAMKTDHIALGTGVTAPDRYHPAVIAQAFATLNEMFPDRILLGLGAGEAMNSVPLGIVFPSPGQRERRLRDSLEIITRLWAGGFVDYPGFFYQLHGARLYTKPRTRIPIFVAAGGPRTAELAGAYGDGVIGFSGGESAIQAAVEAAAKHGKDPDKFNRLIEFKCSYDKDHQRALDSAKVWRSTMTKGVLSSDVSDPRKLEEVGAKQVSDDQVEETWAIVTDVEQLLAPIEGLVRKGFNMIQVHSSSPDELSFITEFAAKVLPHLQRDDPGR